MGNPGSSPAVPSPSAQRRPNQATTATTKVLVAAIAIALPSTATLTSRATTTATMSPYRYPGWKLVSRVSRTQAIPTGRAAGSAEMENGMAFERYESALGRQNASNVTARPMATPASVARDLRLSPKVGSRKPYRSVLTARNRAMPRGDLQKLPCVPGSGSGSVALGGGSEGVDVGEGRGLRRAHGGKEPSNAPSRPRRPRRRLARRTHSEISA